VILFVVKIDRRYTVNISTTMNEWCPFAHVAIDHQPLTMLEQWKASRHRLLWVAVVNRNVGTLPN